MLHIHLDPLGGAAGDMFVAALLDAFPDLRDGALAAAQAVSGVECRCVVHDDGVLNGLRFRVQVVASHAHADWKAIREQLHHAPLSPPVRQRATDIFAVLAAAEAEVHGCAPDEVTFHEVGAADSLADIVAAAWLIDAIGPASWSVGALPLGSGRVNTAHGPLPVPAPATALLLRGFDTVDDGISGERVTPTGASILRHLGCGARLGGVLRQTGCGFGTRRLNGISNCLRVLVLEATPPQDGMHRTLGVITFEVDDQSGEDLAAGLDRVRLVPGVHDVLQMAAFGKKGRLAVHIQVLVKPDDLEAAVEGCFRETTTIGLRTHFVEGRALARRFVDVSVGGQDVRVKLVDRPGGLTAKAEADDLRAMAGQADRSRLRRDAERLAGVG